MGRCALSYFLTPQGKISSEVMLVRLAEDRFYVVSYPEQAGRLGLKKPCVWGSGRLRGVVRLALDAPKQALGGR